MLRTDSAGVYARAGSPKLSQCITLRSALSFQVSGQAHVFGRHDGTVAFEGQSRVPPVGDIAVMTDMQTAQRSAEQQIASDLRLSKYESTAMDAQVPHAGDRRTDEMQRPSHHETNTRPARPSAHPSGRISPVREDGTSGRSPPTRPQRGFGPPVQQPGSAGTSDRSTALSPRSRFSKLSLKTSNLLIPRTPSPNKASSPSMVHWQQLRSHVMASPAEERAAGSGKEEKRLSGLMHKTVGRLGFRQAAENVMGLDQRRQSMAVFLDQSSGLSLEAKEEIIRERRRFARDIKICLDACSTEETRRRLQRSCVQPLHTNPPSSASSQARSFRHTDFSAFAPLLTEMHLSLIHI